MTPRKPDMLKEQRKVPDVFTDVVKTPQPVLNTNQSVSSSASSVQPESRSQDAPSQLDSSDGLQSKRGRLRLLFGNNNLPAQPDATHTRLIDDEMPIPDFLDRTSVIDFNSRKAFSPIKRTESEQAIREVLKADTYDSLDEEAEEDEFIAACAAKEAEKVAKSSSKKKKGKSKTKPQKPVSHSGGTSATSAPDKMTDLKPLAESLKTGTFCPIPAVSKFPYKYIDKDHSENVADVFFNGGKFWERTWDIYYIHAPSDISHKPFLFVPATQVERLIKDINRVFLCKLTFPPCAEEYGFSIPFFDDGTPQPRFLGISTSKAHFDEMSGRIPPPIVINYIPPRPGGKVAIDRSFEAFREKMLRAADAGRKRTKAIRDQKKQTRIKIHIAWYKEVKRAQRYLGLRGQYRRLPDPVMEGLDWEESVRLHEEYLHGTNQKLAPLDLSSPAPYPFHKEPVFICIDIEANERAHDQITEIGISTLDTLDLMGLPPGNGGVNWMKHIRSRHFRIEEAAHVVNKDFVHGCADKFEFGTSEWISIVDAAKSVDSCFKNPYSSGFKFAPLHTEDSGVQDLAVLDQNHYITTESDENIETNAQYPMQAGTVNTISNHNEIRVDLDDQQKGNQDPVKAGYIKTISNPDEIAGDLDDLETLSNQDQTLGEVGHRATERDNKMDSDVIEVAATAMAEGQEAIAFSVNGGTYRNIPDFDLESIITARKSISERVKEDPTILDDAPTQDTYPDRSLLGSGDPLNPSPTVELASIDKPMPGSDGNDGQPQDADVELLPNRPIILLGHDTKADISYLHVLSYDPSTYNPSMIETLDTAAFWRIIKRDSNTPKLGNVLVDLGLTGWHLHNAGNDARYTMEAMIGLMIKSRRIEDNGGKDPDASPEKQPHGAGDGGAMDELQKAAKVKNDEAEMRPPLEDYSTWSAIPSLAPPASLRDLKEESHDENFLATNPDFSALMTDFMIELIDGGVPEPLLASSLSGSRKTPVSHSMDKNIGTFPPHSKSKFNKRKMLNETNHLVESEFDRIARLRMEQKEADERAALAQREAAEELLLETDVDMTGITTNKSHQHRANDEIVSAVSNGDNRLAVPIDTWLEQN